MRRRLAELEKKLRVGDTTMLLLEQGEQGWTTWEGYQEYHFTNEELESLKKRAIYVLEYDGGLMLTLSETHLRGLGA